MICMMLVVYKESEMFDEENTRLRSILRDTFGFSSIWLESEEIQLGRIRLPKDTSVTLRWEGNGNENEKVKEIIKIWEKESLDEKEFILIKKIGGKSEDSRVFLEKKWERVDSIYNVQTFLLATTITFHLEFGSFVIAPQELVESILDDRIKNMIKDGFMEEKLPNINLSCSIIKDNDFSCSILNNANFSRAILTDSCFHDAELSNSNMVGADLSRADLQRANLCGADLSRANLTKACLDYSNVEYANLHYALLHKASLEGGSFHKSNFNRADLSDAEMTDGHFRYADFSESNFTRTIARADFHKATFSSTRFVGTDLSRADLSGANFRNATFFKVDLSRANLCGADLSEAVLTEVVLEYAYYDTFTIWPEGFDINIPDLIYIGNGVDFEGKEVCVHIDKADLSNANLKNTKLSGKFEYANLRGSDLRGANLSEASFRILDLQETLMDEEFLQHLECRHMLVKTIIYNEQTQLDSRTVPNSEVLESVFKKILKPKNLVYTGNEKSWSSLVLHNLDFTKVNLSQSNLSKFQITEMNFNNANLSQADLTYSKIRASNFIDADLSGADLSGAELSGVKLSGANLRNVNFSDTYFFNVCFDNATYNDGTIWPKDFDYSKEGIVHENDAS